MFIGAVNLNQRVASRAALAAISASQASSRSCATFRDASYFCFSASVRWFYSHSKSSSDIMVPRAPLRLGRCGHVTLGVRTGAPALA